LNCLQTDLPEHQTLLHLLGGILSGEATRLASILTLINCSKIAANTVWPCLLSSHLNQSGFMSRSKQTNVMNDPWSEVRTPKQSWRKQCRVDA
jgi:hypothetical protein